MRATSRVAGVAYNTVVKLLLDAGRAAAIYHDENVRSVSSSRIECDEVWGFVYAKEKNVARAKTAPDGAGSVWCWKALDVDSKLIVSWMIGGRDADTAVDFMVDLRSRLENRVQLTTDGYPAYIEAVEAAFGGEVDYAMLVKSFRKGWRGAIAPEARYSPSAPVSAKRTAIQGMPDISKVSTSYVERSNLTLRMGTRRMTRLTNAFSKRLRNHMSAMALYFLHYNFCRMHRTIKCTPAMAAGLDTTVRDCDWIVGLIDAQAQKPRRPRTYRKRGHISN